MSPAKQHASAREHNRSGHRESADISAQNAANRQLATAVALRYLYQFVRIEPKILQGNEPEAIHDFRVASRRLQQVLDLLYPKPRSKPLRKLRRVIRRARGLFSDVRNSDVILEKIKSLQSKKQPGYSEAWNAFRDYLSERRAQGFQKAAAKLSRLNLSDFYLKAQHSLTSPAEEHAKDSDGLSIVTSANEPGPGGEPFRTNLAQSVRNTWESFSAQIAASQKNNDPNSLHLVRIACKRLRYLLEIFQELDVPVPDEILDRLRRTQQQLGDWHDMEVMDQMMAEMLARPGYLRRHIELAIKIERLILRNQKTKAGLEKKYFRSLQDSSGWSQLEVLISELASEPLLAADTE